MSKTTTYRADDKRQGFTAGEIADRLAQHDPRADVKVVANLRRKVTLIEVTDPDPAPAIYEDPAAFAPYPPRPGTPEHEAGL